MQGQRISVGTLPENFSFGRSTSSDTLIDSQMSCNNVQTSAPDLLPEYMISLTGPNNSHLQHVRHDGQSGDWNVGQTSSSATENPDDQNEAKTEHTWNIDSRHDLNLEEHQYQPSNVFSLNLEEHQYQPSNVFSSDIVDANPNDFHSQNRSFLFSNSSSRPPRDLNVSTQYEDVECQVVERPNTSIGSLNEQRTSAGSSSASFRVPSGYGGFVMGENETMAVSLDGRRRSRKRKAFEVVGQTSEAGSSNCRRHTERNQWHAIPSAQISTSNDGNSVQAESNRSSGPEQSNPRFRLGTGESIPAGPFSFTASGIPESSHRSVRLRINGSQQDSAAVNTFSTEADVGNLDFSSSRHPSRLDMRNQSLNLNPAPETESGTIHGQSVLLQVPSVRLNPQSRWNRASNSRTSSSFPSSIPGMRDGMMYEAPALRNVQRDISDHPIFVPASERRSSTQHPTNWNFAAGSSSNTGNAASSSGINSSAPFWTHRSYPQYSRRLSEIVRRSLISSTGTETAGQSSNHSVQPGTFAASSPEVALTGSGNHGHHAPNLRSALLERHLDGAFALPYSHRSLASAGEGRSSIMSEIRHVLDRMRRGEGLRLEDVMLLDHSVLIGMADAHDRHRDMRLDVDNMSYEELLALEERIGNVCTGLSEETITKSLRTRILIDIETENPVETEPCSICREEYTVGDDIGRLECGHDFHKDCIKQWLAHKNLCPICKTTGLTT